MHPYRRVRGNPSSLNVEHSCARVVTCLIASREFNRSSTTTFSTYGKNLAYFSIYMQRTHENGRQNKGMLPGICYPDQGIHGDIMTSPTKIALSGRFLWYRPTSVGALIVLSLLTRRSEVARSAVRSLRPPRTWSDDLTSTDNIERCPDGPPVSSQGICPESGVDFGLGYMPTNGHNQDDLQVPRAPCHRGLSATLHPLCLLFPNRRQGQARVLLSCRHQP